MVIPVQWYYTKYNEQPDYSKLLDAIARSPEERQQLLAAYFEPSDEERENGLKLSTASHRAIATLVASGYVRVIVTTNFDRLIERAIEEAGVTTGRTQRPGRHRRRIATCPSKVCCYQGSRRLPRHKDQEHSRRAFCL